MNDSEIYTPDAPKMVEKKTDMTPTAERLYAIYDKARATFRALQAAKPEEVKAIEDVASDTKKDE